jgi:hypothetical protein
MHPVVGVEIAAAATAAFFAILKIAFIVTCMLIACSAVFGSAVARHAPRFALVVVPVSALMVAHHDLFGISGWTIWRFFNDGPGGPALGYVYQYFIFSFMILGVLSGLQRRHNGDRPFILSAQPLVFNGAFWEPDVTPMVGWWFLSTALAIVIVAFAPFSFVNDYVLSSIQMALDWIWHDLLQFSMVFDFYHFCEINMPRSDACIDLLNGRGVLAYFTVYPIGIFWIAGFVALYVALTIAATFLPARLQWLGVFWFLAGPAIPLFVLTTTYGLHLGYWGTYVAWGAYAAFVAWALCRRHQGGGRAGLWQGLRWGMAIFAILVLASDIDWTLKQRLERNLFGVRDLTSRFEASEGRPRLAWGGLPRLALGVSPTELIVEQVASLFGLEGEASRSVGALTPSVHANVAGIVPSTGAAQDRVIGSSLPLPPPAAPSPPPRASEAGSASRPVRSASSEPVSPSRPAMWPQTATQGLLGQPKEPSSGSAATGVNPR